jgi:hypothetical protein
MDYSELVPRLPEPPAAFVADINLTPAMPAIMNAYGQLHTQYQADTRDWADSAATLVASLTPRSSLNADGARQSLRQAHAQLATTFRSAARAIDAMVVEVNSINPAYRDDPMLRGMQLPSQLSGIYDWAVQTSQAIPERKAFLNTDAVDTVMQGHAQAQAASVPNPLQGRSVLGLYDPAQTPMTLLSPLSPGPGPNRPPQRNPRPLDNAAGNPAADSLGTQRHSNNPNPPSNGAGAASGSGQQSPRRPRSR